jgi:predicted transposase/invertase (TIGR01784 family)
MRNTIRFDWAIKRLLRNKANFGILEGFLSELLGEDIKIESILESESNKRSIDNKMNRVDLLVQNPRGELIIIEVQSNYSHNYLARILFGVSKLMVDYMDKGMEYDKIKKVISVNIVYFDLGHGDDYIYHGTTNFLGVHKNDILSLSAQEKIVFQAEQVQQIYPEYFIIKVNKFNEVAKNTLDEWVNFLKNEEVKDGTKAKGLAEAKEKLDILKLSKEEMREYESDLDAWRDLASGMSSSFLSGKLEGKAEAEANKEQYAEEKAKEKEKQTKLEMARNCKKRGISTQDIVELTGLTEDEIRDITP